MNKSSNVRAVGITVGVAIFVASALFATVASNQSSSEKNSTPVTITESIVEPAEQLGKAFAAVAAHVKPAVVSVYSEKMVQVQSPDFQIPFGDDFIQRFFGEESPLPKGNHQPREYRVPQRGMGSGMIIDKQGYILTNYHVVSEVDEIKVQLADKRSFKAKIVGTDPKTDVVIIKITGDVPSDLPSVQLGDSDALEDGNLVIAIGAPFGLTQTVTHGIISARGRSDVGIASYEDFLQTDAPINPGNSGGPLINMRGEVIGMNSAIASAGGQFGGEGQSAGVGFAIPANMIKTMLPTLIKGGLITRGMLGVIIQDITKDLATHFQLPDTNGALVSQVTKDSPAQKAGLKSGDAIVRYDDKVIHGNRELRNLVAATLPGSTVRLGVIRDGKELSIRVTIGKMTTEAVGPVVPDLPGQTNQLARLGISVQLLTADQASQFGLHGEKGVIITSVEPGSPASTANLQKGDLILEANRESIATVGDLQRALHKSQDSVLLLVKRNGVNLFVAIRMKDDDSR